MARENAIKLIITPEMDQKAIQDAINKFTELQKTLQKSKIEWGQISRQTKLSISNISDISKATKEYSKALSKGVQDSVKELGTLGDQLENTLGEAEALQEALKSAKKGSKAEAEVAARLEGTKIQIQNLNKAVEDAQKKYKNHALKISKVSQSYDKMQESAKYGITGFFKDMGDAFSKGGPGAIGKGLSSALGKGAASAGTRAGGLGVGGAGPGATGAMASAMGMIAKALPALTVAIGAFTMLWQALSAASEHLTKLNKAIVEGTGTANDFTSSAGAYKGAINDLQTASIKASGSLLQYGATSETAAKVINKFAIESTGSLIKTRNALIDMSGSLDESVKKFTVNSIAYGKALGMEAEEVAGMMGKFVSETGYQTDDVMGLMSNVVKAAATANMPMTKFMGIFRTVLPDVELYQNRLEELTGTIKLLSRTMSAKDVQKFMDAFSKGFEGVDFKQRLKTVLMVGTEKVSKALDTDFSTKAKKMAKNFEAYGIQPEEFQKAWAEGEGGIQRLIATARGRAAGAGKAVSGQDVSNLLKLASYESARRKGDPLAMATAMRGSGLISTYKILKDQSQTFTQGYDGLSEHVIKQTGVTEAQYESLRTMSQTIEQQRTELKMYGKTSSKSMNEALKETIKARLKEEGKPVPSTPEEMEEAMRNATEDDLLIAGEMSNKQDKIMSAEEIAQALAAEQIEKTMSVSDKISNIIAFLLEKIYKYALEPILNVIDSIWTWIVGDDTEKEIGKMVKAYEETEPDKAKTEQFKMVGDQLTKAVSAGYEGKDMITAVTDGLGMGAENALLETAMDPATLESIMKQYQPVTMAKDGGQGGTVIMKRVADLIEKQDLAGAVALIAAEGGDQAEIMATLSKAAIDQGRLMSNEAKQRAADRGRTEREDGKKELRTVKTAEEQKRAKEEADVSDLETMMVPLTGTITEKATAVAAGVATEAKNWISGLGFGGSPAAAPGAATPAGGITQTQLAQVPGAGAAPAAAATAGGGIIDRMKKALKPKAGVMGMGKIESGGGGGGGATPAAKNVNDLIGLIDSIWVSIDNIGGSADQIRNTTDDIKPLVEDIAGSLRTGILFESGFFNKYFDKLKTVSLEALRTALLEHAILMAKMQDPEFAEALASNGQALSEAGMGIDKIAQLTKAEGQGWGGPGGAMPGLLGEFQTGGVIPATGAYLMHQGERVIPTGGTGGGTGGGNVYNVTINGTDLSPQQLESAVYGAMDKHARRN